MNKALFTFLCTFPVILAAQPSAIAIGRRVHIETVGQKPIAGTLIAQTADGLVIVGPLGERTPVTTAALTRIRVSEGRSRSRGALVGLGYGSLIVGGGLGGMVALSDEPEWAPLVAVVAGLYGGVLGAGIGAIIGREQWTAVSLSPPRVSVRIAPRNVPGVGLSVSF